MVQVPMGTSREKKKQPPGGKGSDCFGPFSPLQNGQRKKEGGEPLILVALAGNKYSHEMGKKKKGERNKN